MKFGRSWLIVILLVGMSFGLIATGFDCWHAATNSDRSGIERIIEIDREHFRSMQPIWDEYEEQHPGWVRPAATTEETYQQWRDQSQNSHSPR